MADFAYQLSEQDDRLVVETAGSIRGGRKVWILLKGESFSVRDDETHTYLLISNGFDGKTAFRLDWTSVRVVCSNTLHLVLPEAMGGRRRSSGIGVSLTHRGDIMSRVTEAKKRLGLYGHAVEHTKSLCDELASKDINAAELQEFFIKAYSANVERIPTNPETAKQQRSYEKAMRTWNMVEAEFAKEELIVGANRWAAFNAYTGVLQHKMGGRLKDESRNAETRLNGRLFGTSYARTSKAFEIALSV